MEQSDLDRLKSTRTAIDVTLDHARRMQGERERKQVDPEGHHLSLAITHLEDALIHINTAIESAE